MKVQAEADRDFWRSALAVGGFSAIPRWTLDPATGTAEHDAKIPDDLLATLRQLADGLSVTVSSVLLTAHVKVLSALSGEREVATGYVGWQGGQPLLCRLTTEPDSWRSLLLAAHRAESELLAHSDFPVDDLKRDLGLTEPLFETVLDPTGLDMRAEPFDRLRTAPVEARPSTGSGRMLGDVSDGTVLWVGISGDDGQLALRLRLSD